MSLAQLSRLTEHNFTAQLAGMEDGSARAFRDGLTRAAARDALWRDGAEAAAEMFYASADRLANGCLPAEFKVLSPAPAAEPKPRWRVSPSPQWLAGFLSGIFMTSALIVAASLALARVIGGWG